MLSNVLARVTECRTGLPTYCAALIETRFVTVLTAPFGTSFKIPFSCPATGTALPNAEPFLTLSCSPGTALPAAQQLYAPSCTQEALAAPHSKQQGAVQPHCSPSCSTDRASPAGTAAVTFLVCCWRGGRSRGNPEPKSRGRHEGRKAASAPGWIPERRAQTEALDAQ